MVMVILVIMISVTDTVIFLIIVMDMVMDMVMVLVMIFVVIMVLVIITASVLQMGEIVGERPAVDNCQPGLASRYHQHFAVVIIIIRVIVVVTVHVYENHCNNVTGKLLPIVICSISSPLC